MKINKTISIVLVMIMLNINTLAWGSFLPDSKQSDCLSPSIQINFSGLQDSFEQTKGAAIVIELSTANDPVNDGKFKEVMKQKIIANGGKISFADFMQDALYSEHGFFTNSVSVGRDESFDTYAEILPFGYAIAKQIFEMWEKMGRPEKFSIVEMGAGSGALAKNVLSYIQKNKPELYKALDYIIVEISPKLKADQEQTLSKEFGSVNNIPVSWIKGTAFDLSELDNIEGVFVSNEMPDNFPIHRVKKVNGEFQEVYVTFKDGKFQDEFGSLSAPELQDYVDNLEVEIKDGVELPVNLNIKTWQENVAKALKRGFVITIDYGGKINEISQNPYAVWNMETNKMEDAEAKIEYIYANSGNCDITSEVNFYDIADYGKRSGLQVHGYTLQRDFLENMDFEAITDALVKSGVSIPRRKSIEHDISTNFHFKVLVQSKNVDQEIELMGLSKMEDFHFQYGRNVEVILPIGPKHSEFIVYTNDINFNQDIIKKGKKAILDDVRNYGYSFSNSTNVIDGNRLNVKDGGYVLSLSRQDLLDTRIYNDEGQLLFDGWKFFRDNEVNSAIDYEDYEQRYLSNFDLTHMGVEIIPDIFYLHQDGSLQTYSPEFLPKGAMDIKSLPENSLNFQIERAI